MNPRILFVTAECAPWSKTGGLADVSASLPSALRALALDVRVLTPFYSSVPRVATAPVAVLPPLGALPEARMLEATLPNGVPCLLLECDALYGREGGPYQDASGREWPDNALRFGQLSRAAAALAAHGASGWRPDVVHGNDWQGALAPVFQRCVLPSAAASVVTIHNLAFQGIFPGEVVAQLGLPGAAWDAVEYYGKCSFLKGGLVAAGAITTVSPTYAREIQQDETGMGLAGVLRERSRDLHGILNGIDTEEWDPSRDRHLAATYDAASLGKKATNKRALEQHCGWAAGEGPLFGLVGRLTDQKGIDLVVAVAPALIERGVRLVLLGTGDPKLEAAVAALARAHPASVWARIGFDEALAHRIEAGADFFLMPSRFEPCGMNQMYSQRYGTPPIVRATGGLVDSVDGYDEKTGAGTGFSFGDATAEGLMGAVGQALRLYADAAACRRMQETGMGREFGWGASAARFRDLYLSLAR